ncbi:MAG: EcsC family protein [Gammaproteobacteria bacterium]|jgi:hypothetical protein
MNIVALESTHLTNDELAELQWAYERLEYPSLAIRLSNYIGKPIEEGFRLLPETWYKAIHNTVELSIRKSLDVAIGSMDLTNIKVTNNQFHKLMAAGSGAVGGFLGPLTLLAELPFMTMLILRSIAELAQKEGEDLTLAETRLACIEVFALGARSRADDAAETGYYGVRTMLGFYFSGSMVNVTEHKTVTVPGGIELIRAVAARFSLVIEEKTAARMIPIAGAVSGAALNLIFMNHFQDVARGHFIVRRLERKYGSATIKRLYQLLVKREEKSRKNYSPLEGW